jgi:hypothetical protein
MVCFVEVNLLTKPFQVVRPVHESRTAYEGVLLRNAVQIAYVVLGSSHLVYPAGIVYRRQLCLRKLWKKLLRAICHRSSKFNCTAAVAARVLRMRHLVFPGDRLR